MIRSSRLESLSTDAGLEAKPRLTTGHASRSLIFLSPSSWFLDIGGLWWIASWFQGTLYSHLCLDVSNQHKYRIPPHCSGEPDLNRGLFVKVPTV